MKNATGKMTGVEVIRLGPGEDIYESIMEVCRQKNIRGGVILSMHASTDGAKFFVPTYKPETKAKYGYSDPVVLEGQFEMLAAGGIISHLDDEVRAHIHCSFGDGTGKAYGGHLIPGNKVLLTAEIAIGILEEIDVNQRWCPDIEFYVLSPE